MMCVEAVSRFECIKIGAYCLKLERIRDQSTCLLDNEGGDLCVLK